MTTRKERIGKLKARLQQLEAKEKQAERKRRTRRLILWGAIVEEMMDKDPEFAKSMRRRADRKLTRKIDREAMGLPIRDPDETVPG